MLNDDSYIDIADEEELINCACSTGESFHI